MANVYVVKLDPVCLATVHQQTQITPPPLISSKLNDFTFVWAAPQVLHIFLSEVLAS